MKKLLKKLRRFLARRKAQPAQLAEPTAAEQMGFEDLTLPPVEVKLVLDVQELLSPDLYALTLEMLNSDPICAVKGALLEIAGLLNHPQAALIAVSEDGEWQAMAFVEAGNGLVNGVVVMHFYSRGALRARKALIRAIVQFARYHGAERIFGTDMNNKTDAFVRLFQDAGHAKIIGNLVSFDIGTAP